MALLHLTKSPNYIPQNPLNIHFVIQIRTRLPKHNNSIFSPSPLIKPHPTLQLHKILHASFFGRNGHPVAALELSFEDSAGLAAGNLGVVGVGEGLVGAFAGVFAGTFAGALAGAFSGAF